MHMLKNKKLWLLIILLGAGYWWYAGRDKGQIQYSTSKVGRGDVAQTVSVSGTLVADTEIDLRFETSGRVKSVAAKVGDSVGQGEVLATLEATDLDEGVKKAQADLDRAEADAGIKDDELQEARIAVENARDALATTEDAEDRKVDAADQNYDDAKDYEDDAQDYYDQVASEDGAGSSTAKSAYLVLSKARNDKNDAETAKETARANRDLAVQAAENDLRAAKQRVKTLESKNQQTFQDGAIRIARANYEIALDNLEKAQLKAPVNGTVTKLNFDKGEVVGSAVTEPFGRMLSSDLLLEANVPESDIAKIGLGQTAAVTFDALNRDEEFEATVVEVDPESTVIQDVVYYLVKFRLPNIDQRLKPGMSADIDVRTAESKNALFVPTRAIREEGGARYVEVLQADGKTVDRRDVKVGLEGDDGQTEILSGVREDESVAVERKGP
jgi:HlyD family secretion protein